MEGTRNPFDNSICLSVRKRAFGTKKKVKQNVIEDIIRAIQAQREAAGEEPGTIDPELLRMTKTIYGGPAMEKIREIYGDIQNHLERYTIVNALTKPGIYVVPIDQVMTVETYIREKIEELGYWVWQVGEEYDTITAQYMTKLGPMGNPSDYPSVEAVKSKFVIEYEFLAMDVPQKLQYINHSIWQREQEKAKARVQVVAERVEQILTQSMQELVEHLVERLTDTDDGKRKKFATNMVEKARDFFDTFQSRNLTGAESLNDLAEQGKRLLEGVDLDSLKDQAGMRQRVRDGFDQIKASMAAMITVAPRRALNLQAEVDAVQQADYEAEVASITPTTSAEASDARPSHPAVSMTGSQLVTRMVDDVLGPEPEFYPDEEQRSF